MRDLTAEELIKMGGKSMITIEFNKQQSKAIAYDDTIKIGECAFLETNDYWNIIHTVVDNSYRGQGIARKLVDCVIENAKAYNKKIIAECSYAKHIIEKETKC